MKVSSLWFRTLSAGILLATLALSSFAQVPTGAISGDVVDIAGHAVTGVSIEVRNASQDVLKKTVTDSHGHFAVFGLPLGSYDMIATKTGFGSSARTGIALLEDKDAVVNFSLPIATRQEEVTVIGEVTIATKIPADIMLTPASVSSIPSQLLVQQDATTLEDAIHNVAGATSDLEEGSIESFTLRGFDSTANALLLIDGAYEPGTGITQTYNVDRMEVVRGPIGFLYGGNAMAGAVNMVRKRPVDQNFINIILSGGSFGTNYDTLDFNHNLGDKANFRLNALWNSSDNYRDDKHSYAWAINPSLTFKIGDKTTINIDFEPQIESGKPDGGIPIVDGGVPDVPPTRSYQSPFDQYYLETYRAQVNLDSVINSNLLLRNKVYYKYQNWSDDASLLLGTYPSPDGDTAILRYFGTLNQTAKTYGDQLNFIFSAHTGRVLHEFVTGFDFQILTVDSATNLGLLPPIDLHNPVETAQKPIIFVPSLGSNLALFTAIYAPYILDSMRLSSKWHVSLGGRLDILDQKNTTVDYAKTSVVFSPFVGVLFTPTDNVSVYANYGRGFNPISLAIASGNPKPETGQGGEVGVKYQAFGGRLLSTLALYLLKKQNIAIVDQTGTVAQLGDQQSKGVEAEVSGRVGAGIQLRVVYGYTDAVLTRFTEVDPITGQIDDYSGHQPSWAPRNVFNSWVEKSFWHNSIGTAIGLRCVSSSYIDVANTVRTDPYATLDAMVSYQREHWKAFVNLKNLTNTLYYSRGATETAVVPQAGFNLAGGIHLIF